MATSFDEPGKVRECLELEPSLELATCGCEPAELSSRDTAMVPGDGERPATDRRPVMHRLAKRALGGGRASGIGEPSREAGRENEEGSPNRGDMGVVVPFRERGRAVSPAGGGSGSSVGVVRFPVFKGRIPQMAASVSGARPYGNEPPTPESPLHRGFVDGQPERIAQVISIVQSIVHHRGWFIPVDERVDTSQEAILDLVERAPGTVFETDEDFGNFVRVIAHRRCIDWVRARRARRPIEPRVSGSMGPDDELLTRERRELACAVVSRLNPECQRIFACHAGRGMTYAEIAMAMGRTEGAVRMRAHECVKRARQLLGRMRSTGAATR